MDPIKINIEVSLQEATLKVLKDITALLCASNLVKSNPEAAAADLCDELKRPKKTKEYETKQSPTAAEDVAAVSEDKAPAAPAPSKGEGEITDAQLRQAVKDCKTRTSVAVVRNQIFAKYGIESSVECPQSRRAELLNDLETWQEPISA